MRFKVKLAIVIILIAAIIASIAITAYILNQQQTKVNIIIATTTSLYDTGLEDGNSTVAVQGATTLKSAFEAANPGITISFIALGTGDAIKKAQAGDADMILVHSPSAEIPFLTSGSGVDRKIAAYNFFVIVGPTSDPAGAANAKNATQALQLIYNGAKTNPNIQWVARNDSSGTSNKEISLWGTAISKSVDNYTSFSTNTTWFTCTGSGMGASLNVAEQKNTYILSDIGTYLAYKSKGNINDLTALFTGTKDLLNVYSAIIDNPQNATIGSTHYSECLTFVSWLVSDAGQSVIGNYGVSVYNQILFNPGVPLLNGSVNNATLLGWLKSAAYINSTNQVNANGTECPAVYRTVNATNAGLYDHSWDTITTGSNVEVQLLVRYTPTDAQINFNTANFMATVNTIISRSKLELYTF